MNIKKAWWYLSGGGSIPYPSTETAIKGGTGTLNYISFGGTDYDSNKRKYQAWRMGSGHNASADADIILFCSDYGSTTLSAEITIKSDVASYNLTNPNVFVGNSNRVFVTYSKSRANNNYELVGPSDIYFRYSDDIAGLALGSIASATWSSEARLTTDFGELITTSTTSINLNTISGGSVITPNIGAGLTGVVLGRRIKFASASDPSNKFFTATLDAYTSGTGATSMTVVAKTGTTTHTDWNVGLSSYIDGPGKAIHLGAGVLLKPCWVTTGQGIYATSVAVMYKSVDNGANWTQSGFITDANPVDETCIIELPNGNIFATVRDNVAGVLRYTTSTDDGATWAALSSTAITSVGKSPINVSPSGRMFGITRDVATNRTKYFYNTTAGNYTAFTSGFIDVREAAYMYGEVLWDATGNKFVVDWAVEAQNSVAYAGPTLIITKDVPLTVATAPTAYDTYLQSVFDWAQIDGNTMPSTELKTKLNDWFTALRSGSFLTNIDYIRPALNDATLYAIRDRNWIYAWDTVTPVNSPTVAAAGYTFNGTNQRVEFGNTSRPNSLTRASQNDISIYYYTPTDTQDAAFGRSFGLTAFQLITRASDGNLYFRINDVTNSTVTNSGAAGRYFLQRTSSTNKRIWKNGSSLSNPSVASVTLVGQADNMNLGCLNVITGSTYQNFRAETESMFILGKGFSGSEAAYDTVNLNFLTSIGL